MIDWVAVVWCAASFSVLGIAAVGVREARADMAALDGERNGRRMFYRALLVLQLGLLVIGVIWAYLGVPLFFDERIVAWNKNTAGLVASNVILAVISGVFLWVRRRLLATEEVRQHTDDQFAALMAQGRETGEKADAAYHEANSVNVKLADLNVRLIEQGNRADAEIARTDSHQDKQDDRIDAVEEER